QGFLPEVQKPREVPHVGMCQKNAVHHFPLQAVGCLHLNQLLLEIRCTINQMPSFFFRHDERNRSGRPAKSEILYSLFAMIAITIRLRDAPVLCTSDYR